MEKSIIFERICQNFVISIIISLIMTNVVNSVVPVNFWYCFIIISTIFFCLSSFYGDEERFNITQNWPKWLKNLKNVIGTIVALLFLTCIFLLIYAALS